MEWLIANKEWLFSGVGISVISVIIVMIKKKDKLISVPSQQQQLNQSFSINMNGSGDAKVNEEVFNTKAPKQNQSIEELKKSSSILFIDDDRTFKIVEILKRMGWSNTKLVKDIDSLSNSNVVAADILFIDIQGVGKLLQHKDEGLGLALAIKRRYPLKKIIIYSAQENGERFHEALSEADYSLPKTAEPVRFEETIIRVLTK